MTNPKKLSLALIAGLVVAASAGAAEVMVSENIDTSTTWTANNTYNLTQQIYVLPGATLTIEAGTKVMSTPTANGSGSLAVTRGAKIYVNGTEDNPVIMTSKNDDLETWREAANEWGNLTIMGDALISRSPLSGETGAVADNTAKPTGLNDAPMEGLEAGFPGDTKILYGGDNDNDDSGSISYLSIRYGGRVVGLANELNGLSLGGIGRETDIHHVEIMNNVDDGIEIWGGTVEIKYFSVWNIGDDSFDVDQGWRGKAQFGLIVQGYSLDDSQGSGVGDNCFETDGAEDSDAQPVTTAVIYNCTAIGQPVDGDGGTTWRANARLQYRNCIFMDLGEKLVRFDDDDGDGFQGYGFNGTLSWANTWTTDAGVHSTVNAADGTVPGDFNHPDTLYQSQVDGKLAEITDSLFYRNTHDDAYTEATARGVLAAESNNVLLPHSDTDLTFNLPIQQLERAAPVDKGGKTMLRVTKLNPCADPDIAATESVATAPADGFFTPAPYRGAFSPSFNWLAGWTAADAYGFLAFPDAQGADAPEADGEISQVETTVTFDTEDGVVYTVEESTDLENWTPVDTVVGDGTTMSVKDLDTFEESKFYRVIKQ